MQPDLIDGQSQVVFGWGSFAQIAGLIAGRTYCVVTYGEPYFAGLVDRISTAAGPALAVIDDVAPNPDFVLLNQQVARLAGLAGPVQVIVALGGGSVIDTAKVLASAGGDFARVKTYLQSGAGENGLGATPIIAVPTTAGTGSEVTCWATVWDNTARRKYSLNRPVLMPERAVVDPELMLGKSRDLTISTGLDALSHALESIWNINATPESEAFAVAAAREILHTLPKLAADLGSRQLRTAMARASLTAGLAFSRTKTAIAHSISYPVSLNYGVVHGIACSFSLPMILQSLRDHAWPGRASLSRIFGDDLVGAPAQLLAFLAELGVSARPADYGIQTDDWQAIVEAAFQGERGLNFIGTRENFLNAAGQLGLTECDAPTGLREQPNSNNIKTTSKRNDR